MNSLQLTVLLFTALSVCCHGNASPTRLGYRYNAVAASGSTCASAGYTSGCCVSSPFLPNGCYVPGGQCYCDVGCHQFGDCCSDIADIQCLSPRTCQSLGFNPGCCSISPSSSCYVPQATCYCDPTCHTNGDCCIDVTTMQCPAQTQRSRVSPRVENMRAQRARSMRARQRQSEVTGNAADAMANRVQNIQG